MTKNTSSVQQHLAALCARLDNLSPLKVLARGYSVTENERGETLTQIRQVKNGEQIKTRLQDGVIMSRIEHLSEN